MGRLGPETLAREEVGLVPQTDVCLLYPAPSAVCVNLEEFMYSLGFPRLEPGSLLKQHHTPEGWAGSLWGDLLRDNEDHTGSPEALSVCSEMLVCSSQFVEGSWSGSVNTG